MAFVVSLTLNFAVFGSHTSSKIQWIPEYQAGLRRAQQESKFMFVDLSANWCPYCRQLDKNVLQDSKVIDFLGQFVTVRLDYDSEFGQSLKRRYGIKGVPCIMLFDSAGELRGKLDGAPRSSDDFIQYVTEFSQSDGHEFRQGGSAGGQAPPTSVPAWLQPQTRNSNDFSNKQNVPFPAAQMNGQAPLPVVPTNGGGWLQQPQQYSGTQAQSQYPPQQYSGMQAQSQYPPQQYSGMQAQSQYPPQQYPGMQMQSQYPPQQYSGAQVQSQYYGAPMPTQYSTQPNSGSQPPATPAWLQRTPASNYAPQQSWPQQQR